MDRASSFRGHVRRTFAPIPAPVEAPPTSPDECCWRVGETHKLQAKFGEDVECVLNLASAHRRRGSAVVGVGAWPVAHGEEVD